MLTPGGFTILDYNIHSQSIVGRSVLHLFTDLTIKHVSQLFLLIEKPLYVQMIYIGYSFYPFVPDAILLFKINKIKGRGFTG